MRGFIIEISFFNVEFKMNFHNLQIQRSNMSEFFLKKNIFEIQDFHNT